jgi:hypothetical protein
VITAASSAMSNVIIKQPVKLILQGHAHGAGVERLRGMVWGDRLHVQDGFTPATPSCAHRVPGIPVTWWWSMPGGVTDINATRFLAL